MDAIQKAVEAERARIKAAFDYALADTGICWPGEVDILYEQVFGEPHRGIIQTAPDSGNGKPASP
jgi:hypothetical protein